MRKILILTTGGTIASRPAGKGLEPEAGATMVRTAVDALKPACEVDIQPIAQLDGSDVQPEEWQAFARAVIEACPDYDGIVITHGTDTLAYTAAMLSYMLRACPIPVVFTGAQAPLSRPLSDGRASFYDMWIHERNQSASSAGEITGIGSLNTVISPPCRPFSKF